MIGNRLKDKRLALGATQAEIAQRIGVSPQYYGKMERNEETPSVSMLLTISSELDCSVDFLLSGGRNSPPVTQETGKYLKKTARGWACSAKACQWRDPTGVCSSGAGCLKEWQENGRTMHESPNIP